MHLPCANDDKYTQFITIEESEKKIRRSFFVEQGECVFERLQKMTQRKRESQILNPVIFFMTWIGIQGCTFSSLSYHGAVLLRLGTILFVFVLCFFAKGQTIFLFFRLPIKIVSIFISSVQSIRIGLKFKQSSIDTLTSQLRTCMDVS